MPTLDRRSFFEMTGVAATLAASTALGAEVTNKPTPASGSAFLGEHKPVPLKFDPKTLKGMSEKLITSHWENNYGGGVKSLNAIEQRLVSAISDQSLTPAMYGALKREQLLRVGTVVLHEKYFGNLGGDGKLSGDVEVAIKQTWGSADTWAEDFKKTGMSLAGCSGWVILGFNLHTGALSNYWSWDHAHNAPSTMPLLVLDMYEHAFHIDYGAAAAKYVEAFMANVDWAEVNHRYAQTRKAEQVFRA